MSEHRRTIGRRAGENVFEGKVIRVCPDGLENFDDYFTESEPEISEISTTVTQTFKGKTHINKISWTHQSISNQVKNVTDETKININENGPQKFEDHLSKTRANSIIVSVDGVINSGKSSPNKPMHKKLRGNTKDSVVIFDSRSKSKELSVTLNNVSCKSPQNVRKALSFIEPAEKLELTPKFHSESFSFPRVKEYDESINTVNSIKMHSKVKKDRRSINRVRKNSKINRSLTSSKSFKKISFDKNKAKIGETSKNCLELVEAELEKDTDESCMIFSKSRKKSIRNVKSRTMGISQNENLDTTEKQNDPSILNSPSMISNQFQTAISHVAPNDANALIKCATSLNVNRVRENSKINQSLATSKNFKKISKISFDKNKAKIGEISKNNVELVEGELKKETDESCMIFSKYRKTSIRNVKSRSMSINQNENFDTTRKQNDHSILNSPPVISSQFQTAISYVAPNDTKSLSNCASSLTAVEKKMAKGRRKLPVTNCGGNKNSTETGKLLRRSSRIKMKPLANWRNERAIYEMTDCGEITFVGIDEGTKEDDGAIKSLLKNLRRRKLSKNERARNKRKHIAQNNGLQRISDPAGQQDHSVDKPVAAITGYVIICSCMTISILWMIYRYIFQ